MPTSEGYLMFAVHLNDQLSGNTNYSESLDISFNAAKISQIGTRTLYGVRCSTGTDKKVYTVLLPPQNGYFCFDQRTTLERINVAFVAVHDFCLKHKSDISVVKIYDNPAWSRLFNGSEYFLSLISMGVKIEYPNRRSAPGVDADYRLTTSMSSCP